MAKEWGRGGREREREDREKKRALASEVRECRGCLQGKRCACCLPVDSTRGNRTRGEGHSGTRARSLDRVTMRMSSR